jgi:hypothetical protein
MRQRRGIIGPITGFGFENFAMALFSGRFARL